jgi:DNA polymerase-3 subunit delta'
MADQHDNEASTRDTLGWPALLPGQVPVARDQLAQRAAWPPALLVHGQRGIGKHALALNFAQALLCESPRPDGLACGTCASCHYAGAGQHPDLMRLARQFDGDLLDSKDVDIISITRIRALIDFVQITSHQQRAKVAVIAGRADESAGRECVVENAGGTARGTYLILVADQPGRLPATV